MYHFLIVTYMGDPIDPTLASACARCTILHSQSYSYFLTLYIHLSLPVDVLDELDFNQQNQWLK